MPPARPPDTLLAFYRHFIKPVWPVFAVLLVAGFLGSLIEVALMAFVGSLVDMMKAAESPEAFFADHWHASCCGWRSWRWSRGRIVSTAHDLIKNQMIAAPVTNRVRWLTHRYVLRQSLGFFQNDFAGRVANKVMQTAPALRDSVVQLIDAIWYAAVQWVGAVVIFAAADWRLLMPLVVWLAAYVVALFYLRAAHQGALDGGRRGALDADRPHRRQLHQHPDRQAVRPRRARGRLRARRAATSR